MINLMHSLLKKSQLRTKFLVTTILVAGLFMGFSLYQSIVSYTDSSMNQIAEFSNRLLENTYSAMKFPMSIGDEKTVEEQLRGIKKYMTGVQVYITDFNQDIIYASEEGFIHSNMKNHLNYDNSRNALGETLLTGKAPDTSFQDEIRDEPFLVTIKPILNESACHHCHGANRKVLGTMVIKQTLKKVLASISHTRNQLIIEFTIALVGLVVLMNFLFSRLVTKRIQRLREKTEQVAAGDVTVKAHDDYEDSIGKLAHNFNQMVTSIRDRIEYANSLKLGIVDPFFMVDPDMKVTFINENAARVIGLAPENIIGKLCHKVFKSTACEKDCPVKKALQTGELSEAVKMTLTDGKGKEIPVVSISSILKDSSGKVLGAFEIIRDVSAEVEAEKNLHEAYGREGEAKKALENKVKDLSEMLERVGQGDFTIRGVISGSGDAMDILTNRMNETLDAIVNLVIQVKNHIVPVIKGIMQISHGNQSLSQRTQQQASAMEEISATLEQLVTTIAENLKNTRRADTLSKEAVNVAQEGVSQVEKTAHAMVEMSNASQKIVEMMELINEITFQTNLLSINAAVEAARAGEQGRGFAVVANEVRDLAKRSGSASKDIQLLVREIMSKVTTSGQWVDELKKGLTKIVNTSQQVSDALGEVSQGTDESSKGIEQISQGTQDLSDVNEKNAYFVDEISQETQQLTEKAEQLHNIAGVFILDEKVENEEIPKVAFKTDRYKSSDSKNRRKSETVTTPLQKDLLSKAHVEDIDEDLLEKEFEEGFEEF
ncbi:MAG: HAMP domain-containing protein [Proteobacteria bacterium]|nr:HAMP domain-containing protein [Pseudomonadota bacterium]MBU4013634.1 HAMP domain-containing protein [Pseudomonadota bacterium]MBU4069079.1 HAMP domain-containing protein [Pseudomonadota bacterium]MBU4126554.1 HAMP domain-containing protein [Pseudomonadota bacterium]